MRKESKHVTTELKQNKMKKPKINHKGNWLRGGKKRPKELQDKQVNKYLQ
jgi:hypothetical protein